MRKVASNMKWMVLALATVTMTMTAAAQQSAAPQSQPASATQAAATQPAAAPVNLAPPTTMDQVVDRVILRERELIKFLSPRTPIVETYLQNLQQDPQLGPVPQDDHYFLGRMDLSESIDRSDYLDGKGNKEKGEEGMEKHLLGEFTKKFKFQYQPLGFSWMIFADRNDFDRQHYDFHYARREFLGDVRCLVFDLTPKKDAGRGRFLGRIWIEDQDFNIVRLNGTYARASRNNFYFHMDSWRLNLIPGYWIPAYIYSEEGDFTAGAKNKIAFKAQTRMWGYNLKTATANDELTNIRVDSVKDDTPTAQDATPLAAEREWQQQAEDNVVERLERAGLLAPAGDVDKILQTVVDNLEITNNIELPRPVRTRVLTTSPLETFSVGNTIVVSRGLIDVLPDEGSLAMVLAHELAHIVLGHNLGSQYAFNDRMLFSDEGTYQNLGFKHIPEEEAAADKKAVEMLKASPYAQKLETAGLFLKALQQRSPQLNALLQAHLGNNIMDNGTVTRMAALETSAPALDWNKLDQIAALPLGGRVKLNAWDDKVEIVKAQPVAITSARDKMPFEVTPFYPRLSRYNASTPGVATAPSTTAAASPAPAPSN
ncbi:MAG: M48 family metalloprotease [Terriglobales bacterium]